MNSNYANVLELRKNVLFVLPIPPFLRNKVEFAKLPPAPVVILQQILNKTIEFTFPFTFSVSFNNFCNCGYTCMRGIIQALKRLISLNMKSIVISKPVTEKKYKKTLNIKNKVLF